MIVRRLRAAAFSAYANKYGYNGLAAFIRRFENVDVTEEEHERVFREICSVPANYETVSCDLVGAKAERILDQKLFVPISSAKDIHKLQATCEPGIIISCYSWFRWCAPQVVGQAMHWTATREGKPLHELTYNIGMRISDYLKIGLQ